MSHVPNTNNANAAATSPASVDTESGPSFDAGDEGLASGDDWRRRRIRGGLELICEPPSGVQRLWMARGQLSLLRDSNNSRIIRGYKRL